MLFFPTQLPWLPRIGSLGAVTARENLDKIDVCQSSAVTTIEAWYSRPAVQLKAQAGGDAMCQHGDVYKLNTFAHDQS